MTGGLDVRALEKPRQIFSSARNSEEAGSSPLQQRWLKLVRKWMSSFFRNSKALVIAKLSLIERLPNFGCVLVLGFVGTRKEEDLVETQTLEKTSFLRRAMSPMKTIDATETLIERMSKTSDNKNFSTLSNFLTRWQIALQRHFLPFPSFPYDHLMHNFLINA